MTGRSGRGVYFVKKNQGASVQVTVHPSLGLKPGDMVRWEGNRLVKLKVVPA